MLTYLHAMKTAHIAYFARTNRAPRINRASFDDMSEEHANPFDPCAFDARAHDSREFARESFDCFSLSIDTLI